MRTLLSSLLIGTIAGVACDGKITAGSLDTGAANGETAETGAEASGQTDDGTDTDMEEDDADAGAADGGGDGVTDDDVGGAEGVWSEGGSDVADMQRAGLGDGTPVSLSNVVVASTMSIEAPGFYVQDVGGGEWSGVFVFTQAVETASGNPEPAALTVNVGDVLNLSGTSMEYWGMTQLVLESMDDIEVIGTSAAVTKTALDAIPSDWEPYEGVLVSIADVDITGVPVAEGEGVGEIAPETNWNLSVADQLMDIELEAGDSFSSVTGIVTYSWDLYRIAPRTTADLID